MKSVCLVELMARTGVEIVAMMRFEQFDTTRLAIRRLREDDLDSLVAYRSDDEANRWQMWCGYDAERGKDLIDSVRDKEPFTAGDWYQFAVALKPTGALIGDIYLSMDEAGRQAEIGYTLDAKFQGRGYATEALTRLLDHAFRTVGLHRIHATTDPRNEASLRLLRRLGMRQEGHLRQNLWFKGELADDVLFAILASEWLERL